jgi:5-methyltetrahydropteroyltriglutamate--homocysteine methyltransferase
MTVGMHLCRGNFRSRWMAQGGYDPVAERLFNDLNVDAFFLEDWLRVSQPTWKTRRL